MEINWAPPAYELVYKQKMFGITPEHLFLQAGDVGKLDNVTAKTTTTKKNY